MKKAFITLVAASAIAASVTGFAGGPAMAPAPMSSAAGFYVNGNVGYGHLDVDTSDAAAFGIHVDRNSFAWSANAGYQFTPYIAVEAGFMQLPYAKVSANGNSAKLKTNAVTLAAKGIYPVNEQFDVFGKAGLAYLSQSVEATVAGVSASVDNNDHHIAPLFGLGVDYNLNQNVALTLQGITTLKSGDEFPATYTALVGVSYKFT